MFLETDSSRKLLDIDALTVRYIPSIGSPVNAVTDVHLSVSPGEVVGIIGESGSGKSTLAAAVLRSLPACGEYIAGSVLFEGRDVLKMNDSDLRKIRGARVTLIPQDPATALNPVLKVETQISEVLRAHLPLSRRERRDRVSELLREVGFDDPSRIACSYPHELSGGQRQRIVIAQAMACNPALVIADEPTSKLDASLQAEILGLMSRLVRRHGTALIFITHDPAILAGFADRIVVMYAGHVVEDGSTEITSHNPLHPYTQALLRLLENGPHESSSRIAQFPSIPGEAPDLTQIGPGCSFHSRCSERMAICLSNNPQETVPQPSHRVSCFKYAD